MADAEKLSDELRRRLYDDSNVLHKDTILQARCVHACFEDGLEWAEIIDALKQAKKYKEWEPRLKKLANEKRNIRTIGTRTSERLVVDAWPGAPVHSEATIPPGWGICGRKWELFRSIEKEDGQAKEIFVAHDPVVITKRIQDEDGTLHVEIAWRTGKRWHAATYPREMIMESRSLVKAAGRGLPVSSVNATALVEYLQAYEHHNLLLVGRGYSTGSMGWKGTPGDPTHDGYMCGNRQIGGNGRDFEVIGSAEGDDEDVVSTAEGGTFEEWSEAMRMIEGWPVVKLAVFASLAAPLLLPLHAPNMIVELVGPTSRGKTTAMRIAQSCWRSGDFAIQTWNNTVNGFEAKAHVNTDMPLFIDDTKTAIEQGKGVNVAKVIYQHVAGRGRGRASRDGGQKATPTWRSLMISTGEVPASALAKAEGAATRVLSIWSNPTGATTVGAATRIEAVESIIGRSFGHAGPKLVQWLCDNRKRWPELRAYYEDVAKLIRERHSSPAASRLAKVIALLEVTALVADYANVVPWAFAPLLCDPLIDKVIAESIANATAASSLAMEAWTTICSYAHARHSQWIDWFKIGDPDDEPASGWLGWRGVDHDRVDEYAWEPAQLKRALRDSGYGDRVEEILRVWRDSGVLWASEGRFSRSVRCGGLFEGLPRVHWVSLVSTDVRWWTGEKTPRQETTTTKSPTEGDRTT